MKRDLKVRQSFVMDENHHRHIDKSRVFTESERKRHELCLQLLDVIKDSVASFKPSDSLAQIKTLESISHESLYDYFIPEDDHMPLNDVKPRTYSSAATSNTLSKPKKPKVEIDIVVSGGGLKGYFMTGCSHILKHELKKQNISIRRIAGASAGAWVGLFMLCDFSTSNWIETYYLCRDRITRTIHDVYEEMWPWAQEHLPPNAYEICSGRLFISITEVTWCGLKNHIISEFTSNQDLFEACLASSAIPYLTFPGAIKKYRGMYVLDGGITNNTPIFPDLPRRTLVFRLTDIFYPAQLLVSATGKFSFISIFFSNILSNVIVSQMLVSSHLWCVALFSCLDSFKVNPVILSHGWNMTKNQSKSRFL